MTVDICAFRRANCSKCFNGGAFYGRCASKKENYFRFEFYELITIDRFLTNYVITSSNIDDINEV